MKKKFVSMFVFVWVLIALLPLGLTACAQPVENVSLSGYIMDEHCYVLKPVPGSDTKKCLQMEKCAATGYGIAVLQDDDTYKFYYFDGEFSPDASGAQVMASDLINNTTKVDHIYITVQATMNGESKRAADGTSYPLITVTSMEEAQD